MKKAIALAIALLCICTFAVTALAHGGKTDGAGGHTERATGEYHYHHGYPAHQHTNGVCPYEFDDKTDHSNHGGGANGSHSSDSTQGSNTYPNPTAEAELKTNWLLEYLEIIIYGSFILFWIVLWLISNAPRRYRYRHPLPHDFRWFIRKKLNPTPSGFLPVSTPLTPASAQPPNSKIISVTPPKRTLTHSTSYRKARNSGLVPPQRPHRPLLDLPPPPPPRESPYIPRSLEESYDKNAPFPKSLDPTFEECAEFFRIDRNDAAQRERYDRSSTVVLDVDDDARTSATAYGSKGDDYSVTLTECSCADFAFRHAPCKHMYALVRRHLPYVRRKNTAYSDWEAETH